MSTQTENNKRIAKNTMFLYIKLFISIIVGLYTSRLVLNILGVSDYGLYSIIGGLVVIMNFLGGVMTSTSYRFIAVELGKKDGNPNRVYNTILVVHYFLALLLIIIGEIAGVYYVQNIMNIEPSKISDAIFVLHWTILSSATTIIAVPSSGLIIAKEKFLYTSIIEILRHIVKLLFVIYLSFYLGNALRMYSVINFIFMSIVPLSTIVYCKINFKSITKYKLNRNISDYKNILSFAGWSTLGAGSIITLSQGNNMILNYFLSTTINAAYGLANQINGYVMMFVKNIGQAAVPQIMKQHSAGKKEDSINIVYNIAKYSFFFILYPAVPFLICIDPILELWLGTVPEYTAIFAALVIISNLFWCVSVGFDTTIQASGNIKYYQIFYSMINISILPVNYLLLRNGMPPFYVIMNLIFINFIVWILQIFILYRMKILVINNYWNKTLAPALRVILFVSPLFLLSKVFSINNLLNVIIVSIICILWIIIVELYIGLNKTERNNIFKNILKR